MQFLSVDEVFLMGNFKVMAQNRQCDIYDKKTQTMYLISLEDLEIGESQPTQDWTTKDIENVYGQLGSQHHLIIYNRELRVRFWGSYMFPTKRQLELIISSAKWCHEIVCMKKKSMKNANGTKARDFVRSGNWKKKWKEEDWDTHTTQMVSAIVDKKKVSRVQNPLRKRFKEKKTYNA